MMEKIKFPKWTPPDLIRIYEEGIRDNPEEKDLLDIVHRLGTDETMESVWTWLLENQKKDVPKDIGEQANEPLIAHLCSGIAFGLGLAQGVEINNPIPLNVSNKKLAATIKKSQSLIEDIEGNYRANRISKNLIANLVIKNLGDKLNKDKTDLSASLFSIVWWWKKKFSQSIEERQHLLADKKMSSFSVEDEALLFSQESISLGLVEILKYLCSELDERINQTRKMSKSVRNYMLPALSKVFEIYFDKVPREQFCMLVSVIEYDRNEGFNALTWDDIKPYLPKK